jgi:hypothetical protein
MHYLETAASVAQLFLQRVNTPQYHCNTASLRKPAQAIMLLTCIQVVLSPDLSLYADYPEDFHGFPQFPQVSTWIVH